MPQKNPRLILMEGLFQKVSEGRPCAGYLHRVAKMNLGNKGEIQPNPASHDLLFVPQNRLSRESAT
jgi:hypothetical protein